VMEPLPSIPEALGSIPTTTKKGPRGELEGSGPHPMRHRKPMKTQNIFSGPQARKCWDSGSVGRWLLTQCRTIQAPRPARIHSEFILTSPTGREGPGLLCPGSEGDRRRRLPAMTLPGLLLHSPCSSKHPFTSTFSCFLPTAIPGRSCHSGKAWETEPVSQLGSGARMRSRP
jgi:hypothetical protein